MLYIVLINPDGIQEVRGSIPLVSTKEINQPCGFEDLHGCFFSAWKRFWSNFGVNDKRTDRIGVTAGSVCFILYTAAFR